MGAVGRLEAGAEHRAGRPAAWHPDAGRGCSGAGSCEHRGPLGGGVCTWRDWVAAATGLELHLEAGVGPWRSESRSFRASPENGMGWTSRLGLNSVQGRLDSLLKFTSLPNWSHFLLLQAGPLVFMSLMSAVFIFIFCCVHSCSMHDGPCPYT